MDRADHSSHGTVEIRKGTNRGGDRFWNTVEPKRNLSNDAQGALGAYKKSGQVITCCGLAGPSCSFYDPTIGHYHRQRQHILPHGAITDCVGAGRAACSHPTDRGVRTGINREEKASIMQVFIELLAGDPWLDHYIKVLIVNLDDLIHLLHVD